MQTKSEEAVVKQVEETIKPAAVKVKAAAKKKKRPSRAKPKTMKRIEDVGLIVMEKVPSSTNVEVDEANRSVVVNANIVPEAVALTAPPAPPITRAPAPATVKAGGKSTSQEIWDNIKGRDLGLFGLFGQTVSMYCELIPVDPNKCYIKYKVSSVIPALENAAREYKFETIDRYIVLSKKDNY